MMNVECRIWGQPEQRKPTKSRHICCFCHVKDSNKNKIKKSFVIVNDFTSSNSSIDNYLLIHSICDECHKNLKQNELNNNLKKFFCDFCGEEHHYNKIKFNLHQKGKACCTPI